jgi:flavorubredoxin
METYRPAPDIDVITTNIAVPAFGLIPVNAFVFHGAEPLLVDTGPIVERDDFMAALRSVIDPSELKWIWLTHTDFDHIGALHQLLDENAELRVITSFVGVGIMGLYDPLPMDRLYLINPGQTISIGDRTLTAVKPPTFDNPITTGFHDDKTGAFVSSDSFGALLQEVPQSAADLSDEDLTRGQVFWATVDSPWLHKIDRGMFKKELDGIRQSQPSMVLSSHLPAAPGDMIERFVASLMAAPDAEPFAGPDQAALEAMLAEMTGSAP